MTTLLSRDNYTGMELHRERVPPSEAPAGGCAHCGQFNRALGLYRFWTRHPDKYYPALYCSVSCFSDQEGDTWS